MTPLQIGLIITATIFFLLALLFTWLYMKDKSNIEAYKSQGQQYSAGSYKGWWYRYKYSAIIFLSFTFLVIGVALMYIALFP